MNPPSDWSLLLVAALAGALLLRLWAYWRPARIAGAEAARQGTIADVVIGLGVLGLSTWYLCGSFFRFNPNLIPYGEDVHDYWKCMVSLRDGDRGMWLGHRYPLYPALGVLWAKTFHMGLANGGMMVSLASGVLTPPFVYVIGRTLAPRPVALASALIVIQLCAEPLFLGTGNAYPLATALYLIAFGTLLLALRSGGGWMAFLAGLTLALYAASTAKAFPFLWLGAAAMVAAQVFSRRRQWWTLGVFFAPLVVAWVVFAYVDLPLFPLEGLILDVHLHEHVYDPAKPFPDVGWQADTPLSESGYWVYGRLQSFTHLPQVVAFLLSPPVRTLTLATRYEMLVPPMADSLGLGDLDALVWVAMLGVVGVWSGPANWQRKAIATGTAFALAVVHLWGISQAVYAYRYAMPSLMTTPPLLLGLAALPARSVPAHWRREWLAFLPLLGAVWWVLGPSDGTLGRRAAEERDRHWHGVSHAVAAIFTLKPLLQPDDVLLDIGESNIGRSLFDGYTTQHAYPEFTSIRQWRLWVPPLTTRARWVILPCVDQFDLQPDDPYLALYQWVDDNPDRFQKIERCIYRDTRPTSPIDFAPAGTESEPRAPHLNAPELLGGPSQQP